MSHISKWVMSHICDTYKWVWHTLWHMALRHTNATCECDMPHSQKSHVTHVNRHVTHVWMSHGTHMWNTQRVMPHNHVTQRVTSHIFDTSKFVCTIRIRHVTCTQESRHTSKRQASFEHGQKHTVRSFLDITLFFLRKNSPAAMSSNGGWRGGSNSCTFFYFCGGKFTCSHDI